MIHCQGRYQGRMILGEVEVVYMLVLVCGCGGEE